MRNFGNFIKYLFCAGLALAFGTAYADTGFKVPIHYNLELVDGISGHPDYSRFSRRVDLKPGRHQIVVSFKDAFGDSRNSQIVQSSNPVVIDIADLKPGQVLTFKYKIPDSVDEAMRYARQQLVELTDIDGRPVPKTDADYFIMTSENGFTPMRDYRRELLSLGRLYAPTYVAGEHRGLGMTSYGAPTVEATTTADDRINGTRVTMDAPATSAAQEGALATSSTRGGRARPHSATYDQLVQLFNSADSETKKRFIRYVLKD